MKIQGIGEKGFYKKFFTLFVTLVLQNVITLSVNLADNMMLGAYSETSLAGVAAVNQVQFVYQQLLFALGDGLVILGSQYFGRKQLKPLKKIAGAALDTGLLLAAALFLAVSFFPGQVLQIFTTDASIIGEGVRYLSVIRFTYVFFAITQILLALLRSIQIVKIAMYLSILTFFINCGLNSILIYGRFGAPELGAAGAAIGTLTARIVECGIVLFFVLKKEKAIHLRADEFFRADKKLAKDYFKLVAPMVMAQGIWGINTALQTVILGHMTAAAIAANSVASTLFLLMKSMAVGAACAAGVMIGKVIGEGDMKKVKSYSVSMQRLFVGIGILSGILLYAIRIPVLNLYRLTPGTKEMANEFLLVLCVIIVGMSYQMPTNNGIIRGGGNAAFVLKMDMISICGIVLPLSFFMAFVVKASPLVVVCCLNADQIFKCVPAFLESHYGNWARNLVRDIR